MTDVSPVVKPRTLDVPAAAPIVATVAGAAAAIALRLIVIARYRFDSDETQHLHVAWAWAHGLVQYRDVFDNHMPLFHMLFAALVRVAGEKPSTLFIARLAMLPFFGLLVWLTYRVAATCLPRRAAVIATFIGCLAPDFFLCSVEFRTDVLWAASWLLCVYVLVRAPLTRGSAALAGLALGTAGAISAKTSLLAVSLIAAALLTMFLTRVEARRLLRLAPAFAIGAVIPVASIAAFFRRIGAWDRFVYCTVTHNVVASDHRERLIVAPLAAILIVIGTRAIIRQTAPAAVIRRRVFLFLTASIYVAALVAFWPIIQTEHWLPFYPVAAAGFAPLLLGRARQREIAFALITASVVWTLRASTPWIDHGSESLALIEDAMRLTSPREHVVDLKGEIVFRPRASYWVFEKLTKRAIAQGRIEDPTIGDVLRTRAMVAVPDSNSFPERGRAFLLRNFISVGCVRVAGKMIRSNERFTIEVPAEYALITDRGALDADIDGVRYTGPRPLAIGPHIVTTRGPQPAALVWQRAVANGFSPFAPDTRCDDAFFRIEERKRIAY